MSTNQLVICSVLHHTLHITLHNVLCSVLCCCPTPSHCPQLIYNVIYKCLYSTTCIHCLLLLVVIHCLQLTQCRCCMLTYVLYIITLHSWQWLNSHYVYLTRISMHYYILCTPLHMLHILLKYNLTMCLRAIAVWC